MSLISCLSGLYNRLVRRDISSMAVSNNDLKDDSEISIGLINCRLDFECKSKWIEMMVIDETGKIRFCSQCKKNVYWVSTIAEFKEMSRDGKCMAFNRVDLDSISEPTTGYVELDKTSPFS